MGVWFPWGADGGPKDERKPSQQWGKLRDGFKQICEKHGISVPVFCDTTRRVYIDHNLICHLFAGEVIWDNDVAQGPFHDELHGAITTAIQ